MRMNLVKILYGTLKKEEKNIIKKKLFSFEG
jgi:hypothetical protein